MKNPESILITGASSGIGAALAVLYAKPGVTLALSGRDQGRLDLVAAKCRALGADVSSSIVDVANPDAMHEWMTTADISRPLDLVIANAGVSLPHGPDHGLARHTADTFAINVEGVFNTVHPALDLMRPRKAGQIAIMSSIAGFHGLPSSPAYSTSKAAVKAYGEALRGLYKAQGIEISVICPGFVISPMTDKNRFPMPFLMPVERAALVIRRGLQANKGRIAFPLPMVAVVRLLQLLPESWLEKLLNRAPHK